MTRIRAPEGAETAFRLQIFDAFGGERMVKVHGAGKWGWVCASQRDYLGLGRREVPLRRLRKGQQRTLLNFIGQSKFWELSEYLPPQVDGITDDGSTTHLWGQEKNRSHHVYRFIDMERGLEHVQNYLLQISTLNDVVPEPVTEVRPGEGSTEPFEERINNEER